MANCYVCDCMLTAQNETEEHIIINACGGRLKPKDLICRTCNSEFGEDIDAELAKQTNDLANFLLIKRHRGEPQPIIGTHTKTGEKVALEYGGKPAYTKPTIVINKEDEQKTTFSISARNTKEFKQILNGLKRKYPNLDIDSLFKNAEYRNEYLDAPIEFQTKLGGDKAFRAITKTAINYFLYKGGDAKYIKHLIQYLKGEEDLKIAQLYYPEDIYTPSEDEVTHVIRIIGNPKERILYGYIEIFNVQNFLVLLNDGYDGVSMDETYVFEPFHVKEIVTNITLSYSKEFIVKITKEPLKPPFEEVKRRYGRALSIGQRRLTSNLINRSNETAVKNSLGKYPEGTLITQEIIDETINEIMKEISPLIANQHKIRQHNNI